MKLARMHIMEQASNEAPIIKDLRNWVLKDINNLFSVQDFKNNIKDECEKLGGEEGGKVKKAMSPILTNEKELHQLYLGLLYCIMESYNIKIKNKKCRAISPKLFQETFCDLTGCFRHDEEKTFFKYGSINNTNEDEPICNFINNIRFDFERRISDFLQNI